MGISEFWVHTAFQIIQCQIIQLLLYSSICIIFVTDFMSPPMPMSARLEKVKTVSVWTQFLCQSIFTRFVHMYFHSSFTFIFIYCRCKSKGNFNYSTLKEELIIKIIQQHGHLLRMSKDRIQKKDLNMKVTGKHIKGRNRGGGKGRKPVQ